MKRLVLLVLLASTLAGCGGFDATMTKVKVNITKGDFRVTQWSGGKAIKTWEVKNGYISTEGNSDGWFFNFNGKLVRLSGTVTIEQI